MTSFYHHYYYYYYCYCYCYCYYHYHYHYHCHYRYHYHQYNDHHHHQGFAFLYKLGLLSIEPHWDYQIEIRKKTDEMNNLAVFVVAGLFSVGTC